MSNLLQSLSSLVIFFVISTCIVSAGNLGVSPHKASLDISVGETKCVDYSIYSAGNSVLLNVLWSGLENPYSADDYFVEKTGIEVIYSPIIYSNYVSVCFKPNEAGEYKGLVLFDQAGSNLIVGSKVEIHSYPKDEKYKNKILGFSVLEGGIVSIILIEIMFILIAILSIILIFLYRRRKESY